MSGPKYAGAWTPDVERAHNRALQQQRRGTKTAPCPVCRDRYAVNPTGTVYAHRDGSAPCAGSGMPALHEPRRTAA